MTETTEAPYRAVDRDNVSWINRPDMETGEARFRPGYADPELTWDQLREQHGPVRPVLPITDEDHQLLRDIMQRAGRKSIATIAAALETVFHNARQSAGGLDNTRDSWAYAERTLKAGRPGSWESDLLMQVVLFGNGLNLDDKKRKDAATVDELRALGPTRRVDVAQHARLVELFTRWVASPDRYTEVAENLAAVISEYADEVGSRAGWADVADQWLMPGGLAREDISNCYRLFYSLSEHYDPNAPDYGG